MLIQLTIENFLSFRDEVTFSMVGVSSDRQHAERLIENGAVQGKSVLPIAAIYGANAAGKSNLIEAVSFAKDLILEGTRSNRSIPVSTFKLGDYSKKPSKFEFIFTHQGSQYSYGFKLNRERIFEEWLYGVPAGKKKEIMYFERVTSSDKKTTVDYGTQLTGKNARRKQFLEFIAEGTRPNQLLLTEAVDRNVEELFAVTNWFMKVLTIIPADCDLTNLEVVALNDKFKDGSFTNFLCEVLKSSGTGIDGIEAKEVELDFDKYFPNMSKIDKDEFLEEFLDNNNNAALLDGINGKQYVIFKNEEENLKVIQMTTQHRHEDGTLVDFTLEEESEGSQRLIDLIPVLFMLKFSDEEVIFIDEIDRRLHPLLSYFFVKKATDSNVKENQLIFTTHETNLLDLELLRRDEIWFVEKDSKGASSIYSLAEFKTRPDLKIEKGYLNGRFGAIPFFGNAESLGWHDRSAEMVSVDN